MIIDTIANAQQYTSLHPLFSKAFDFINQNEIENLPDGVTEIAEGLKLIVNTGTAKTAEASLAKFECHDKNIDIQLCVKGNETFAWKPREKCITPNGEYNPDKDVRFFNDQPDMFFQLTNNQFAILFPQDVHAPMIGEGEIKKLVFKVKI